MKVFYIIILVFLIMLGGVLLNKTRVNNFTAEAIEKLYSIKPESNNSEARVKEITDSISDELKKFEFSISRKKVNMIRDYSKLLVIQCRMNNFSDFEETRELLVGQLQEIDEAERISFLNIV